MLSLTAHIEEATPDKLAAIGASLLERTNQESADERTYQIDKPMSLRILGIPVSHLKYHSTAAERRPSAVARDQHQAEGKRLLEKHAIAPSAARLR